MHRLVTFTGVALVVATAAAVARQPVHNTVEREEAQELNAQRSRLVAQADAAWDREMAREAARDCEEAGSTYDENVCLIKRVAESEANLKAYVAAFRSILSTMLPASEKDRDVGPAGRAPTAAGFDATFDKSERAWRTYSAAFCQTVYASFSGGGGAPGAASRCRLRLVRSHMRDLNGTLGDNLRR